MTGLGFMEETICNSYLFDARHMQVCREILVGELWSKIVEFACYVIHILTFLHLDRPHQQASGQNDYKAKLDRHFGNDLIKRI